MFSLLGGSKASRYRVGVSFNPMGVACAVVKGNMGSEKLIAHAIVKFGAELENFIKRYHLKGAKAVLTLEPDDYSLVQIEAPEAPKEEMPLAIRWRVKDIIDFHIDDAKLDFFMMPEGRRSSMPSLMYVAAIRSSELDDLINTVNNSGLVVSAVDITELTLRNLFLTTERELPDPEVLLFLGPRFSLIEIFRGGVLFLTRRIKMLSSDLQQSDGSVPSDLMEGIILELQRSIDYCDSQFDIPPIKVISIVCHDDIASTLVDYCAENFNTNVRTLRLEGMDGAGLLGGNQLIELLPAIGAAVRAI